MCRPDGRHVLNNQGTDDYVLTFDEVNEEPVIYHWKYKLEEIDPNEEVVVDTLPVKKSS